jgi:hypothetical protein
MKYPEDHIKKRAKEKASAIARLEQVITYIEAQQREPDHRECVCLAEGIACIFSGVYRLAAGEAYHALVSREEDNPFTGISADTTYDFTLDRLKKALDDARQAPVEPHPRFGETVLEPVHA